MTDRPLYVVQLERFDAKRVRPLIEEIARNFARYLDDWRGGGGSRHALMGAVAGALDLVRRGDSDFGDIMGRTVRAHEMAVPFLSSAARQALAGGVKGALELTEQVPPTARRRVLEQVEYHVYYLRRTELLERLDEIFAAWRAFVQEKYGEDISAVQRAWGRNKVSDFSRLPFPSRKRAQEDTPLGRDVRAFLDARKEVAVKLYEAEEQAVAPGDIEDITEGY